MKMNNIKPIEEFSDEWNHFCKCINFGASFLDARAITFMNEFGIKLREHVEAVIEIQKDEIGKEHVKNLIPMGE